MDERDVKECIRKLQYLEQTPSVVRLQKLENRVEQWKVGGLGNEKTLKTKTKSSACNGGSGKGAKPEQQSQDHRDMLDAKKCLESSSLSPDTLRKIRRYISDKVDVPSIVQVPRLSAYPLTALLSLVARSTNS